MPELKLTLNAQVFKHLLPRTAAAAPGAHGAHGWLPLTFDASSELDAVVGAHDAALACGEAAPLWYARMFSYQLP